MQPAIRWVGDEDGRLEVLDQTLLPDVERLLLIDDEDAAIDAISRLAVRGAPALGVVAAFATVLGVRARRPSDAESFTTALAASCARLAASRPTAVNLAAALARVRDAAAREPTLEALLRAARSLADDDARCCKSLAEHGVGLVRDGATVLTHCNTGRLATAGDGTALGVLFEAHRRGVRFTVLADETRPLLQGSRLTALELSKAGIAVELIVDSAAAGFIARGEVDVVLCGADRIARNGDVANKVGTYGLALAAAAHDIPFWIVAPTSTFDLATPSGDGIPIEERDPREVLEFAGRRVAPQGVAARNPGFDVTPARLLTGIVTEHGRISPVDENTVEVHFQSRAPRIRCGLHEFRGQSGTDGAQAGGGAQADRARAQDGRETGPSQRSPRDATHGS